LDNAVIEFAQEGHAMTASTRAEVESAWRQRLSRFAQSGQTVKAFCHEESVSACSFYHWRERLQQPTAPCGGSAESAAFVDLGAITASGTRMESAAPTGAANLTIRVDLPGGIVLTIARG